MGKKRLLWQLYPSYLLITLVSLAAVTLYGSRALRRFHLEQTKADLQSRARLIQEEVRRLVLARDPDGVDRLCKELGKRSATRVTVVRLPSGLVLGDSDESPSEMERHSGRHRQEIPQAVAEGSGSSVRFSHTLQKDMAYVAIPLKDDGGKVIGVVRTSVPLTAVNRALAGIYWKIAFGGLLVALAAAALSMVVSRRISRPLEVIKDGAERFAQGDLSHKLAVPSTREIAAVAETMNAMAAELDRRIRTAVGERNEREAILSSMVEGVLAVDCGQRVLGLNRAAAELFGTEPGQAQRRNLQEVVRSPELQEFVSEVLSSGQPSVGQVTLYGQQERVLHAHGTVLRGADGQAIGGLVVLHDVTRTKKLENIRRDFVANVSHELKTPITSIKGYVETLLEGAKDRPEDAQRFLEIIAAQTDRLDAIIEDLLSLSRIEKEAEQAEVVLERGPIREVLEAAIEASEARASEHEVRIELACGGDVEARINAPLLEQAVVNLIDNACKYSPRESVVRVEAAREGAEVVIRVRDTGCGIERHHLERIFERFYRVDKARSRKLGGTGLGLAIVKHIAQAHCGRVVAESTPGEGSTFSIYLPGV